MVLLNADILPQHIQWSLRSIIEKTHTTTRYILTCSGLNKIEKPIISRMLQIRLPNLTYDEIYDILTYIADEEDYEITEENIEDIIEKSEQIYYV